MMYRLLRILVVLLSLPVLLFAHNLWGFLACLFLGIIFFSLKNKRLFDPGLIPYLFKHKLLFLARILSLALLVYGLNIIRFSSNIEFLFKQEGELLLKTPDGFTPITSQSDLLKGELIYKQEGVKVLSTVCRRKNESFLHRIENFFNPNELRIFEFSPNNSFSIYADIEHDLKPLSSRQALMNSQAFFSVNASFYGKKDEIQGELIIGGESYGYRNHSSGFFKVIDGVPYVGPKSLFEGLPGEIEYSCQAFPSVMKNGELWEYILTEKSPSTPGWRRKTYRNLIGTKANGNLVFILSNSGALLSVKEISLVAQKFGLIHASLFDGGVALQYDFKTAGYRTSFSSFNNSLSLGQKIDSLIKRYFGIHFMQKSPVFITIETPEAS